MPSQPAHSLLDSLGVSLDLDAGDLVANAVVLAKVIGDDGEVTVVIGVSDGTSWLDQLGLLTAASEILRSGQFTQHDDSD